MKDVIFFIKFMRVINQSPLSRSMYSEYIMSFYWEICLETQIRKSSSHRTTKRERRLLWCVCLSDVWEQAQVWRQGTCREMERTHVVWWLWHEFKAQKQRKYLLTSEEEFIGYHSRVFLLRRETFPHSHPLTFNMWRAKPQSWEGWLA